MANSQLSSYLRILAVYALIILTGSALGHIGYFGREGDHFFASRSNLLNKYFVKLGWGWFTPAFWLSVWARRPRNMLKSALNYCLGTTYWLLFTQWLRGPPLMDRIFLSTGGSCELEVSDVIKQVSSSSACRKAGGVWVGGHDPSGHVFILVHTSMLLWTELLPSIRAKRHSMLELAAPLVLMSLWAGMLFTTSLYFHSILEKMTGLIFGSAEVLLSVILLNIGEVVE